MTPDAKWRRLTEDSAPMREAILVVEHADIGEGEYLVRLDGGLADELGAAGQVEDDPLREEMRGRLSASQEEVRAGRGAV